MLFGAAGDLATRKLYPSLFNLYKKGTLQSHFALIGTSRRQLSDDQFHQIILDSIKDQTTDQKQADDFVSHMYFKSHDVTNPAHYQVLKEFAAKLDQKYQLKGNRIFYISMAPRFFGTVAKNLKEQNVLTDNGFNRLIIEKPFGRDYKSAESLNNELSSAFNEDQIFRIDHYLGKEMVQNIIALRFGNPLIESVWNNKYIDNVQVTLAENMGVGVRAGYYDSAGALRDMVQNHIMQVVSLLAMEEPDSFTDVNVRAEKVKALKSLHIYDKDEVAKNFVRGQYGSKGDQPEYRKENGVDDHSNTETYVGGKLEFRSPRWAGVPFYVRSGKLMKNKTTRIDVVFKKPAADIFALGSNGNVSVNSNVLTIQVDPNPGYALKLNNKKIGQGFGISPVTLNFTKSAADQKQIPQPYERLLHDALKGDHTNFASWQEVGTAWKFVDPIRQLWDSNQPDFPNYNPQTNGPEAASKLLSRSGRKWVY